MDSYITLTAAVQLTGLSRQRIHVLAKSGRIRRGVIGSKLGYHRDDLIYHITAPKRIGGRPKNATSNTHHH